MPTQLAYLCQLNCSFGSTVRLSMDAHRAKELATMTGASEPAAGMGSMGAG